jgi:hypothetical protein
VRYGINSLILNTVRVGIPCVYDVRGLIIVAPIESNMTTSLVSLPKSVFLKFEIPGFILILFLG